MKNFVLEVVFDHSFFEKVRGKKKFRYRTRSEFTRFRSGPQNMKQNAALHLAKFLDENIPFSPVTVRLYEEIPAKKILAATPSDGKHRRFLF